MSETETGLTARDLSFSQQVKTFPKSFWVANLMEMIERLSFYSVRAVAGLFIVDAAVNGGLELTHMQRGTIMGVWALIQTILPMFTGGFSDRYGYKISLYIAFTINTAAYVLMGYSKSIAVGLGMPDAYLTFFLPVIMLATGTAIFKPPLHGTLAHTVDKRNSSVGWGFFYMLVNVGGFLGPILAAKMRIISWDYVFFAAAVIIALNILPTIFLFKDYSKEVRKQKEASGEEQKGPFATFSDSMSILIRDFKFVLFLLIFSGFWLMFMQLFDTLPIFIEEWVDSRAILAWLHNIGITFIHPDRYGNVPPEMMVNLDAGTIVLLMLPIGYITGKFKPVVMMVVGMLISTVAIIFTGSVSTGGFVLLGIFFFAIGEMACSPKFSEYIGLMAPPERKALYMGYSNVPFAIGWGVGGIVSGFVYGRLSDKYHFARDYMVNNLGMDSEMVANIGRTEVMPRLAQLLNIDTFEATRVLWDAYNPWNTWVIFGAIGAVATLAMLGYHFWLEAEARKSGVVA